MELLQELFNENFLLPIQDWCHEHGMLFTGHVLHEDTLTTQACMLGSVMRAYEFMDIPGMDWLGEHRRNYWWRCGCVRAAAGKNRILTELYGCPDGSCPCGHQGDRGLAGVVWRQYPLSAPQLVYDGGRGKAGFPGEHLLPKRVVQVMVTTLREYFSRLHMLLAAGTPVCDTLVINPVRARGRSFIRDGRMLVWRHWMKMFQQVEQHYESCFWRWPAVG